MTLFAKKTKTISLIILSTGGTKTAALFTSSQTFYKVPKNIRDNCSHFCIFRSLPRENKRIADEIGVDHNALDRATDKNILSFTYDKPQKLMKKNFDEVI